MIRSRGRVTSGTAAMIVAGLVFDRSGVKYRCTLAVFMEREIKRARVGWQEIEEACRILAERVRKAGFEPEVLAVIMRGGGIVGRLFQKYSGSQALLHTFGIRAYSKVGERRKAAVYQYPNKVEDFRGRRVLIIDDICDSGTTLELARKWAMKAGASEVKTLTLHYKSKAVEAPDFWHTKVEDDVWIDYPWE